MEYEKKNKDAISTIKQALRQLSTNGVPVGNIIKAIKDIEEKYAESDDERIRGNIIATIHLYYGEPLEDEAKEMIAWLEKQGEQKIKTPEESLGIDSDTYNKIVDECIYGEQKPIDKVEPNFKVGDWVVTSYGKVNQVVSVDKYGDGYTLNDGVYFSGSWCDMYHLWTIQDAKDGDVLAWDDSKCIALFKNIYDEDSFNSYGFIGGCTGTFESRQSYHDIEGSHPATKEQRDLLFHKMHESGYEWDAEKKELIKIEQKPSWIEEDEEIYRKCICAMRASACGFPEEEKFVEQVDNWFKSLKERYTWKPSEEQMRTLEHHMHTLVCTKYKEILFGLYSDLKELRGE